MRTAEKSLQFQPVTFPIANILTVARIIMIPLVVILFFMPQPWAKALTGWLFILAALTDSLDGYLARKLGQTSALGAFLDPVADKLMVAVALILLVSYDPPLLELFVFDPHMLIAVTATVIVGREITISALREWMAQVGRSKSVAVNIGGKVKTVAQLVAIPFLLFNGVLFGMFHTVPVGRLLIWIAAFITLWSMLVYLKAAWATERTPH